LTADIILPGEVKPACLSQLIQLIQQRYEQTVVDLPRLIDPLFSVVMEKADHAIVVLQQDIASLKDALRLIQILIVDLDMPVDRILPVVNRYEPFASIKLVDVERTLGIHPIATVPNDYRNVHTAEDLGIPLAEYAPRSPATLSIYALAETLSGLRVAEKRGLLKQFLTKLWSGA
jgi:pilus assembly protein CpaE